MNELNDMGDTSNLNDIDCGHALDESGGLQAGRWIRICSIDDIPVLGARVVERGPATGNIAVFRNGENKVFALLDRCPHEGGPLSQGIVYGDRVACPLHGWSIELAGGCAVSPDEGCTPRFAVKVDAAQVYLEEAAIAPEQQS